MITHVRISEKLSRFARVLLVFVLVAGTSFRVELAIAGNLGEDVCALEDHTGETLTNLHVYELGGTASGSGDQVVSLTDMIRGVPRLGSHDELEIGDAKSFVIAPEWDGATESAAAGFIEWEFQVTQGDGDSVSIDDGAVLNVENANAGYAPEEATLHVECSVSMHALEQAGVELSDKLQDAFGADGELRIVFDYDLLLNPEEREPEIEYEVSGVSCDFASDAIRDGVLELTAEQGAAGFQLVATVAYDVDTVEVLGDDRTVTGTQTFEYASDAAASLSETSDGLMGNVEWELTKGAAGLDEGFVTLESGTSCVVTCSAGDAAGEHGDRCQVSVVCGADDNPPTPEPPLQGADHHTDELTVSGHISKDAYSWRDDESFGDEEEEGDSSSSERDYEDVDGWFSSEELMEYYSDEWREGEERSMFSSGNGPVKAIGDGLPLSVLLYEAGVGDCNAIDEISFYDYKGDSVTLSWSSMAPGGGPFIALNSAVIWRDDPNTPELLPNTRYRIMFQDEATDAVSAVADADSLCYISEIVVNPNVQVDEKEGDGGAGTQEKKPGGSPENGSENPSESGNEKGGEDKDEDEDKGEGKDDDERKDGKEDGQTQPKGLNPDDRTNTDKPEDDPDEKAADEEGESQNAAAEESGTEGNGNDPNEGRGGEARNDSTQTGIPEEIAQTVQETGDLHIETLEKAAPGAQWVDLSRYGVKGQYRDFLKDNPLAPFAIPISLGTVVSGGVEKLLSFRRQVK